MQGDRAMLRPQVTAHLPRGDQFRIVLTGTTGFPTMGIDPSKQVKPRDFVRSEICSIVTESPAKCCDDPIGGRTIE